MKITWHGTDFPLPVALQDNTLPRRSGIQTKPRACVKTIEDLKKFISSVEGHSSIESSFSQLAIVDEIGIDHFCDYDCLLNTGRLMIVHGLEAQEYDAIQHY